MEGLTTPSKNPPSSSPDHEEIISSLRHETADLKHQLAWFKRQIFGSKSEKFTFPDPDSPQMTLGEDILGKIPAMPERKKQKITYERGVGPKVRPEDCVNKQGLRFGPDVPVKTIHLPVVGCEGVDPDEMELVTVKEYFRLAQRPASYVVLCYKQPVYKRKDTEEMVSAILPMNVVEKSVADVSFLTGLLVEKFVYHQPLYRQHQRLENNGIKLSRATLTNLVKRAIGLLEPIVDAQLASALRS